jgi:hypothetical protein
LCVLAIAALGCGVLSQEEQLLTRFFETARLHDTTVLAKYATVTFNPRTEGVVQTFDVEKIEEDAESKRVNVRAQVRGPAGDTATRLLLVTMRRVEGSWRITELRDAP